VDDIVLVEVVDRTENLFDGLGGILFGELALLANAIEQLSARGQFCHDVVFVLTSSADVLRQAICGGAYSRLEPVLELDNVRVLQALEHLQLVVHHAFIALHILLEDNLDGHLAVRRLGFPDNTVSTGAERSTEPVFGPTDLLDMVPSRGQARVLLIVALGLAVEPVQHVGD